MKNNVASMSRIFVQDKSRENAGDGVLDVPHICPLTNFVNKSII